MGFHDVQLDPALSFGFQGGPGFNTVVQTTASGHEERIARWSEARHRYTASKELLAPAAAAAIKEFYLERRGSLFGFRFKDWLDYSSDSTGITPADISETDCVLGTGDGSNAAFQLLKTYGSTHPYTRVITLPVAGSVVAALDGTLTTAFTVDTTTGTITFTTPPGSSVVVSAGFQFDTPVRFSENTDQWLNASYTAFELVDLSKFELVEILDETQLPETWDAGGSYVAAPDADFSISAQTARVLSLDPQSSGINVYLPVTTYLPGGEYFRVIIDAGSSGTLNVLDDSGGTVDSGLAAGDSRVICLIDNGATKTWVSL